MKKALVLILILLMGLAACGESLTLNRFDMISLDVSLTVPEGRSAETGSSYVIYSFGDSRLEIWLFENAGMLNYYLGQYKNVTACAPAIVAGLNMVCRTFEFRDILYTEYYALLEGGAVSIKTAGNGSALLDSLSLSGAKPYEYEAEQTQEPASEQSPASPQSASLAGRSFTAAYLVTEGVSVDMASIGEMDIEFFENGVCNLNMFGANVTGLKYTSEAIDYYGTSLALRQEDGKLIMDYFGAGEVVFEEVSC